MGQTKIIMNELTKKILKAMGLTDAQIKAMDGDAPTAVETDITKAVADHQRTLLENDSAFLSPIRDKAKAEIHTSYEKALKKAGLNLTDDEIKTKSAEDKIKALAELASKGKDKTVDDLNAELMATKSELLKLKDEEIPAIKAGVDAEKKTLKLQHTISKEILRLTEEGKNLRNPLDVVESALYKEFGEKYTLDLDDKGSPVFKDKTTGVGIKTADGTKMLSHEDILKEAMTRGKFLAESNADDKDIDPATGKKRVVVPKPGKEGEEVAAKQNLNIQGLSAAEKHLADMKAKAAADAAKKAGV